MSPILVQNTTAVAKLSGSADANPGESTPMSAVPRQTCQDAGSVSFVL